MSSARHFARSSFRKYAGDLHRYLLRRVGQAADADDLAQEVFLRLMRVKQSDRVSKPLAYLYGIAAHVVYEFRIREQHNRVTYDSTVIEHMAEHPDHVPQEDLSDRLHLQQQLARALMRLPPGQRAVLLMVKREGMSHEEAAKALGLTVQTVEKYMVNAKAQIRMDWDT